MSARGSGGSPRGPRHLAPRALAAEKARLARRLQSIEKHRAALELAIEQNFEAFTEGSWREAFESVAPHDANRTIVVTGDHSAILNSYVEILRAAAGSRLLQLLPYRRPRAEEVFAAIEADGGLSARQVTTLNQLYKLEGRLEHASPDVDADEVFQAIELLRRELPSLIKSAQAWLADHDIDLKP